MITPAETTSALALVREALREDLNGGADLTTRALIPDTATGRIRIVSRQSGILCGGIVIPFVLQELDSSLECRDLIADGSPLNPGTVIATLSGNYGALLTAERTILNFLTLLSGTATLTRRYVDAVAGTKAVILDTRKTLPGLRTLQKYAVRCGGGSNHRIGLYDAVLVKDNHLAWFREQRKGSLADAAMHVRSRVPQGTVIEFEVDSIAQLQELLPGMPEIVLLDNMTLLELRRCVELRNSVAPGVLLEASGGVNLQSVAGIAATGVDRISVGALTHSAPALDIGFDW